MVDRISKKQRSYNMSQIRSKNTKPELVIRKFCHSLGLRFRLHYKKLKGKPDIYFPKYKTALFVNGCFWHRHSCKLGQASPKTNISFWREKFQNTLQRDNENYENLLNMKINIIIIWECEVKNNLYKKIIKNNFGYDVI